MGLVEGSEFNLVELETCVDDNMSRPRVRPLKPFPTAIRVEFPRPLRENYPIGTRFRADVIVCQKHNKDGSLRGNLYLSARPKTIILVEDFTPSVMIMALQKASSASGRSYEYVEYSRCDVRVDSTDGFKLLRERAIKLSSDVACSTVRTTTDRERNTVIKLTR